jgi:hypothetical protein
MEDADEQFELWKADFANHMLQAAHAATLCMQYAPEGTEVTKSYLQPSEWLVQHAEEIWPSREAWPELPDNVIPITKAKRRK